MLENLPLAMYTVSPYLFIFPKIREIYMPIKQIITYIGAAIRIQITAATTPDARRTDYILCTSCTVKRMAMRGKSTKH